MKRILFIGGLTSGGAEHQMVVVATLLKQDGYDVTFLCPGDSDFFQKNLEEAGIPIIRIRRSKIVELSIIVNPYLTMRIHRILRRGKYDTVISFLSYWNYLNCKFAHRKGTAHRAITGIRNNRDEVFLNQSSIKYTKYERFAYRKVSNSDAARVKFSQYFPNLDSKLLTIYNIVDLPTITSTYQFKKDNLIHIIVPASYREVKNPMGMLKAVALLKEQDRRLLHIDWYGSISGGRECYKEMKAFIAKLCLEDVVSLYDATNDIANRINEADIVGLFSTSEGLPNAICEGMMLGKPIVMTRVSDYNVLAGNENGILCNAGNPQSIAEALSKVARLDTEDLKTMGAKSKEIAYQLFSKEVVIKQWESII